MVDGILKLQGVVQHYDWGGHDFIPHLLEVGNPMRRPFAELWMGAHAKAPSLAEVGAGSPIPLDKLIAEEGATYGAQQPSRPIAKVRKPGRPRGTKGSWASKRWLRLEPIAERMRQKYGRRSRQ